jgi:oligopeptide transport system permease protein
MENVSGKWERFQAVEGAREKIHAPGRSFGQDVWFRFRQKKSALGGLIGLVLVGLFAFIGPYFMPDSYSRQNLDLVALPPRLKAVRFDSQANIFYITSSLKIIELTPDGKAFRQLAKAEEDAAARQIIFDYGPEGPMTLDYAALPLTLTNHFGESRPANTTVWNKSYPLGTDHLGRNILTRLMYGCRISLVIAFVATFVNMVIGTLYGVAAGFAGGRTDAVMMRVVDIINTIPLALYVILIKVTLNNSDLTSIIIALSSVYWVNMARIARGQALSLKAQEFVTAARTIGTSTKDILLRHILPNAMGPILVTATMLIPSAIFMEAFMSYIGIGVAPPMASLGTMCNDATEYLRTSTYQLVFPALMICLIMFAFNFLGDGLRDALDPKLKK